MVFTGTRIRVNATVPKIGYTTRVGFYIDGTLISTYANEVPAQPTPTSIFDYDKKVTIFDQDGLPAAKHTLRAMSVGNDGLFLFDVLEFEAAVATAVPTSDTSTAVTPTGTPRSGVNATVTSTVSLTNSTSTTATNGTTTGLPTLGSTIDNSDSSNDSNSNNGSNIGTNANTNGNNTSSSNNKSTTTIVAGVIGGLAGVVIFILIGFFLLKRHRQKKEEMLYDDAAKSLPWNENAGVGGSTDHANSGNGSNESHSEMGQRPWQVPMSQNRNQYKGGYPMNQDLSIYPGPPPAAAGSFPAFLQHSHPNAHAENTTIAESTVHQEDTQIDTQTYTQTDTQIDTQIDTQTDIDIDARTYQTLPSYHERVRDSAVAAGRNLSQADINAISQRLTEMMRTHILQQVQAQGQQSQQSQQSQQGVGAGGVGAEVGVGVGVGAGGAGGQFGDPHALNALSALNQRVIVPPRELIDHLVEERLGSNERAQ